MMLNKKSNEDLLQLLPYCSPFHNAPVYFIPETTSTMTLAERLVADNTPFGTVVVTDFQSAGQGRRINREWNAETKKNLLCTVIHENTCFPDKPSLIPLIVGLSVCMTLERETGLFPLIRWPNDIMVNDRKICGILCRSKGPVVYIGVGINLNQTLFSVELEPIATSTVLETNAVHDRDKILQKFLEILKSTLDHENPVSLIESRLWQMNEPCIWDDGDGGSAISGIVRGLGASGELTILPNNATMPVFCVSGSIRKETKKS